VGVCGWVGVCECECVCGWVCECECGGGEGGLTFLLDPLHHKLSRLNLSFDLSFNLSFNAPQKLRVPVSAFLASIAATGAIGSLMFIVFFFFAVSVGVGVCVCVGVGGWVSVST
jgi:hypothetical protein